MFREYFEHNKENLREQLEKANDLQQSYDLINSFLRNMQNECSDQLSGDKRKEVCRSIVDSVISAVSFIQSGSKVDILFKNKASQINTNSQDNKKNWWYYIGVIISVGLMAHFIFLGSLIAAIVCGALSLWQVIVLQHVKINSITSTEQPEIVSSVRLNVHDFMQRLSLCVAVMDEQLRSLCANVPTTTSDMKWSNDSMEILQVLWCEQNKGEGNKLSDIVNELFECLQNEGLIISSYSKELDRYFDKMPGRNEGETLSPVLMSDNRVFVRGTIIKNN